jgi:hypothetical protein
MQNKQLNKNLYKKIFKLYNTLLKFKVFKFSLLIKIIYYYYTNLINFIVRMSNQPDFKL